MYTHTCIPLNYSQSCINAWSHLVAGENSNKTKINARSQINTRSSFVGPQYLHGTFTPFPFLFLPVT